MNTVGDKRVHHFSVQDTNFSFEVTHEILKGVRVIGKCHMGYCSDSESVRVGTRSSRMVYKSIRSFFNLVLDVGVFATRRSLGL